MAKCFPDFIPAPFDSVQRLADAYRMGWNHGHGRACHNVPSLGSTVRSDALGTVTVDADNIREVHESFCFESEGRDRDFSPFEFIAHEFNCADEDGQEGTTDELWEAFDAGVAGAIFADVADYTDEDYGIVAA